LNYISILFIINLVKLHDLHPKLFDGGILVILYCYRMHVTNNNIATNYNYGDMQYVFNPSSDMGFGLTKIQKNKFFIVHRSSNIIRFNLQFYYIEPL